MFEGISEYIINCMLKEQVIKQEDIDIYRFGLHQMLILSLNIITTIAIGVLFRQPIEALLFVFFFSALRKYAGGFHASTVLRCYLLTTTVLAVTLWIIRYVDISCFSYMTIYLFASVIVLILAPLGTSERSLDAIETIIYRKRYIIMWIMEMICFTLGYTLKIHCLYTSITIAQMVLMISLLAEYLLQYYRLHNNK
ncbi:MAG: accessory gene regulator B family protein [Lachnospiraceae bacterium]|nr:accessory gene regulator B family protein [Lachnospiraceae bacterium]